MNNNNGFGTFVLGFIVGGVIGAIVALLYAPQSGKETQEYIRAKGIELKEKAIESTSSMGKSFDEAMGDIRKKADDFSQKAQEDSDVGAEATDESVEDIAIEE